MEARIVEGLVKDQNGGRSWRKIKMATSLLGDGRWRFGVGVLGWRVLFLADAEKFWRDEIHSEIL